MSFWVAGGMAVVGAYSALEADKANNKAMDRAAGNASRRYEIKAGIAQSQMEEQNQMAMEQMTDVARSFLKARGKVVAMQAEGMVGGNVQKRIQSDLRLKESETKGKVAKQIDTNVINIAQDMIAEKIDTEALINEALSKKKNGLTMLADMTTGAGSGAITGFSLSNSFSAGNNATSK